MNFRRTRKKRKLNAEINVVPYIDVMLVLLVIFMVTAPLLTQGIKVDLPKVTAESLPQDNQEPLVVSLNNRGEMFINRGEKQDKAIDADQMLIEVQTVLNDFPETSVLIHGDKNVRYEEIVEIMAALQSAGVTGMGLVTEALPSLKP